MNVGGDFRKAAADVFFHSQRRIARSTIGKTGVDLYAKSLHMSVGNGCSRGRCSAGRCNRTRRDGCSGRLCFMRRVFSRSFCGRGLFGLLRCRVMMCLLVHNGVAMGMVNVLLERKWHHFGMRARRRLRNRSGCKEQYGYPAAGKSRTRKSKGHGRYLIKKKMAATRSTRDGHLTCCFLKRLFETPIRPSKHR